MKIENKKFTFKNLKFINSTEMFAFSIESILLPHFCTLNAKTTKILDIGTNNAIIPLILSKISDKKIIGVEVQKSACEIGEKNVSLNNKANQIEIINQDIKDYSKLGYKFNQIVCNPPFFSLNNKYKLTKKKPSHVIARHEVSLTFDDLLKYTRKLLNNKGYFTFCHRTDRLEEILLKLKANNLTPKRLQFIHPYENQPAQTFLLEARFQSNAGLKVLPPIICHNKDGSFKKSVLRFYHGK